MIHSVTPQRSDVPATTPGDDPPAGGSPPEASPPGPISWELTVAHPRTASQHRRGATAVAEPPAPAVEVPAAGPRDRSSIPEAGVAGPDAGEPPGARPATVVEHLGPVGRRRSPALIAVLSVATLGLFPILWFLRANREMRQFDPRMTVRPGRTALAVAIPVLLALGVALAETARILLDRHGLVPGWAPSASRTRWLLGAPALGPSLLVVIPPCLVAAVMTLERVRIVEDRGGVDPEQQLRPAAAVSWALVPVVGLAAIAVASQRRLNRVWERCG